MPVSGHCDGLGALCASGLFAFLFFLGYLGSEAQEGLVWKAV